VLKISDADTRLSKLSFQADEDWESYPRSVYTCPHCGSQTGVTLRDLDRHSFSDFTNLSATDSSAIAHLAAQSGRAFNSFLDFYCPGCRRPVRVCFDSWAGGRYTHGHELVFVVERAS
jgi:hypothetical protein